MATKKQTTKSKEIKGIPDKPVIPPPPPPDPLLEMKVKTVSPDDIKQPPLEKSDIILRLEVIEKEIKDVKHFLATHFSIKFKDWDKEIRG